METHSHPVAKNLEKAKHVTYEKKLLPSVNKSLPVLNVDSLEVEESWHKASKEKNNGISIDLKGSLVQPPDKAQKFKLKPTLTDSYQIQLVFRNLKWR